MDYQLKPLGKTCSKSGAKLLPGDVCYSAVVAKGNEWERIDFSREAWQGPPEDALGYWRTKVPPQAEPRRRLDPDAILTAAKPSEKGRASSKLAGMANFPCLSI